MISSSIQRIISTKKIADNIVHIVYTINKDFQYIPGQFVGIQINPTYRRAYSIYKSENEKIEFLINTSPGGIASQYFKNCKIGDTNLIIGPYGRFFLKDEPKKIVFLICTGTGIVPYLSWLNSNIYADKNIYFYLVYGLKYLSDDLTVKFLDNTKNLSVIHCITREDKPKNYERLYPFHNFFKGRVTDYLNNIDLQDNYDYYVCGADEAVKSVVNLLREKNINRIFTESYG